MSDSLAQARALLAELTEAAQAGRIIPVRLPGQLEAIAALLEAADGQAAAPEPAPAAGDVEAYRAEIGQLFSHAFHDLRLPLTSIRGYADMLANPGMGELSPMQQQFVGTIRSNTRRLESLMTDVGDLNKIWNGTLRLSPKMDMFKNIALTVEKQMRPLAEELNRNLTFDIAQGLPLLNLDSDVLVKALCKLVENALRYTHEEGHVQVRAERAGGGLLVTVADDGIGMNEAELAQLGTPFVRGDSEHVLAFKGSGLGAALAFRLVAVLGGRVEAASAPEQGTTLRVILPAMG